MQSEYFCVCFSSFPLVKLRLAGSIHFVLKSPHAPNALDSLPFHFEVLIETRDHVEGTEPFYCKEHPFASRFSILEGPPSIIELSIIQYVCIPFAPNIQMLSDIPINTQLLDVPPDASQCDRCHSSFPFPFDFRILPLNQRNLLVLFLVYEPVSWTLVPFPRFYYSVAATSRHQAAFHVSLQAPSLARHAALPRPVSTFLPF